jgi:urease accessory protein
VERYTKAPFGSVRASYPDGSGIPEVQITNPSGGILGGDRLEIEITLDPVAATTILTQAANKAYRGTEATQRATFYLGEDAFLEYLPHHLIPFADSNYRQESDFFLKESSTLVAWDAYSAGRVARGERFAFSRLSGRTRVLREGVPLAVEGFDLPFGGEPFGGYSYLGTLYILAPSDLKPLAEELHRSLSSMYGVAASASSPETCLCTARILARDATTLYRGLERCRGETRTYLDLSPPARDVW